MENRDRLRAVHKRYRTENKAQVSAATKKWQAENSEQRRATERKRRARKYRTDPIFKLTATLRNRFLKALQGKRKLTGEALSLLGCSVEEARAHLEAQFTEGMSWDNWCLKGWHVEHIRPLASFDLADPDQRALAFRYTNLQPMWWQDNLIKGAKYETCASDS